MSPRTFDLLRSAPVRYAVAYALVSTVVVGALLGVIYWSMITLLQRHLDEAIGYQLDEVRAEYRDGGRDAVIAFVERHEQRNRDSPVHFLVRDAGGEPIAGDIGLVDMSTVGWQDIALPPNAATEAKSLRGYGEPLSENTFLLITHDTRDLHQTRELIITSFGVALALTVSMALIGGLVIGRTLLGRVEAVNRTARAIMDGDLSQRIPVVNSGDELGSIAENLNRMLTRIQELMENLRQVSNDIAHDLRTPLGRLQQRLQKCRVRAQTPAAFEEAIDGAISESTTILESFDAVLRIAQIEAGARRSRFAEVDVSAVLDNVCEVFSAAADDERKKLEAHIEPGVLTLGDRELLTQMLANIVDNAIRHTPSGSVVTARVERRDGCARVEVADDGPGIPIAERPRVLRRFYRLDASRATPGSGLGLSLVAAVVKLHEARLSLEDNEPGLRVRVDLPAVSAA